MRRVLVPLLLLLALAPAAGAGAKPAHVVHVTIRHETNGCHAWSVDGGAWRAALTVELPAGGSIEFTNDDAMTHRLVQLAGPRLQLPPTMLVGTFRHPGAATVRIVFAHPGTYRLRTIDGPPSGLPTTGADNVLRLTVDVD